MKITFLGATHEVTGSCTLIETLGRHILIDCGMEQGADTFENQSLPVGASELDAILLTHAHIDHSGKLPLLFKNGCTAPIFTTEATASLSSIMLRDCAHIQMSDAEWKNRKAKRAGDGEVEPLYDLEDAENVIKRLRPCVYGAEIRILENVCVSFTDVGHLLGSAAIKLTIVEGGETRDIVFSGDIGNHDQPILRDPEQVSDADYVVIESTYGDRLHPEKPDYIASLTDYLQRTFDRGGNVVIPAFAVGRTQEMLYFIRTIKQRGLVKGHDGFPVYLDSPLAIEATGVFMQCGEEYFDDDMRALLDAGVNPLWFDDLRIAETAEQSKAINFDNTPKVIISASGMCEAGRIRHHLKHNLWRSESTVLFVGYQSVGTLGRIIADGAESVRLFGEEIAVEAEIGVLAGVSGHADKNGLINWLGGFKRKPKLVFVNHGDDEACTAFTDCLVKEHGYNAVAPYSGWCYDLITGQPVSQPDGIPAAPHTSSKARSAFNRLIAAVERLLATAKLYEGKPNKDIGRFISQIDSLNDSWKNRLDN